MLMRPVEIGLKSQSAQRQVHTKRRPKVKALPVVRHGVAVEPANARCADRAASPRLAQ